MSLERDKSLIIWMSALGMSQSGAQEGIRDDVKDAVWAYYMSNEHLGLCETLAEKRALTALPYKNIFVVLPGQWARISTIELPKMRAQDSLSAAGFAIEDQLGSGLSEQHIALGPQGKQEAQASANVDIKAVRVGAISVAKMNKLNSALSEAGLKADGIYIDHDVIPNDGSAYALSDRIIKAGPDGFTLDPNMQAFMEKADNGALQIEIKSADAAQLSQSLNLDGAVNFLQGAYASKRFETAQLKSFTRIGALAAGLAVSGLIWTGLNARAAKLQAVDMSAQMRDVYQLATGQRAPSNPALAVSRAIRSGGEIEADFLSLSALLFSAMTNVPDVSVDNLQFEETNNRLTLRLIYPSFDAASDMEEAVSRLGGRFQTGGVREQGERLVGDAILTLEPRS